VGAVARAARRATEGACVFLSRGERPVRDDRRRTARALARRLASSTIALPVAALPRGATPPIRASRGREGSKLGSSPGRAAARVGEVARAARRATEGACACSRGERPARDGWGMGPTPALRPLRDAIGVACRARMQASACT